MKSLDINRKTYHVQDHEFEEYKHKEFFKLKMYKNVGKLERVIGLLRDIGRDMGNLQYNLLITNEKDHGGFVYENVKSYFSQENNKKGNDFDVLYINSTSLELDVEESLKIVITTKKLSVLDAFFKCFILPPPTLLEFENEENKEKENDKDEENVYIYVENEQLDNFLTHFHYYFDEKKRFLYDNLVHLCMIVKNAGDQFEQTLQENLPFIDRWTIVDTGSTDNTVEIINRVLVGKKKGTLYHRPFVNFRETRNECLELAGHDNCKFNIMLDDTYRLKGQVRKFLSTVRDDQFADSYTMMIQSHDSEYFSNRITKQELKLRYIYKIHEVIQGDNNVQVTFPHEIGFVQDFANDYMEKRTKDRKMLDLKLLEEMVQEDPDNPRHIYYIAQTYSCLDDHEKFAEYLEKRVHHPNEGFVQEKLDACFELARCYEYRLGRPWKLAKKYYKMCYEMDKTRPDSLYMIGMHYHLLAANNRKKEKAFEYFLKAFQVGYPVHCQYGLKPTLSYFYLPKFLIMYCFEREQYDLCYQIVKRFFEGQHFHKRIQDDDEINSTTLIMSNFFSMLDKYQAFIQNRKEIKEIKKVKEKKTEYDLVIVADGGYTTWTGSDIETKGVGGSETWVIETAVALNALGKKVIVFCNTEKTEIYKGVYFKGIRTDLVDFLNDDENVSVKNCIISRYSEYILMCAMSPVVKKKKVSLILHDLGPSGNILPMKCLDNVFCLSNWHKSFFMKNFSSMDEKNVHVLNYGYSPRTLTSTQAQTKKPFSFIYSSFPNRGLKELLFIWPKIHERIPVAELNIYSDINHPVMLQQYPELMMDIASLIEKNKDKNINYHGWVDKVTLENGWKRASFWLYPCTFMETFCLTAVEAAYHKVCAITNNLAGLQDTVGDRGYFFDNQDKDEHGIEKLLDFLINQKSLQKELVEKNYEWASRLTWHGQSLMLLDIFKVNETRKEMQIVRKKFYSPIQEVLDWNRGQIKEDKEKQFVLELGPGPGKLFCDLVTHTVDINDYDSQKTYKHECHLKLDICKEKLNFEDNFFCYGYSRHVFEDIPNALFAFQEITRVATKGFIETPSPLVEILRGVDNWDDSEKYRGYYHHFSLVFTDFETNTLCLVPKLPILERVEFPDELLKNLIEISETNPLAWNNYYIWDKDDPKKQPRIKIYSVDEILSVKRNENIMTNKIYEYGNFIIENVIPTFIKSFNKIIPNFLKRKKM